MYMILYGRNQISGWWGPRVEGHEGTFWGDRNVLHVVITQLSIFVKTQPNQTIKKSKLYIDYTSMNLTLKNENIRKKYIFSKTENSIFWTTFDLFSLPDKLISLSLSSATGRVGVNFKLTRGTEQKFLGDRNMKIKPHEGKTERRWRDRAPHFFFFIDRQGVAVERDGTLTGIKYLKTAGLEVSFWNTGEPAGLQESPVSWHSQHGVGVTVQHWWRNRLERWPQYIIAVGIQKFLPVLLRWLEKAWVRIKTTLYWGLHDWRQIVTRTTGKQKPLQWQIGSTVTGPGPHSLVRTLWVWVLCPSPQLWGQSNHTPKGPSHMHLDCTPHWKLEEGEETWSIIVPGWNWLNQKRPRSYLLASFSSPSSPTKGHM